MKNFSRNLLFGAVLAALPMGGALACTTDAWDGVTSATAAGPDTGVARYSGECALEPAASGGFVMTETPDNESVYRARFYVYTGTGATGTVFAAYDAAGGSGGSGDDVLSVDFDGSAFVFQDGSGAPPTIGGIAANRWYSVEVLYQVGSAGSARVVGGGGAVDDSVSLAAGGANVESAELGAIAVTGAADSMKFDEFESIRDAATEIGPLCRGNAQNSGSGATSITITDASAIIAEIVNDTLAPGQPDTNENGVVDIVDASGVVALIIAGNTSCGA